MKTTNWFTDWFNTPYYHILYQDRNDTEAEKFMGNLVEFLKIKPSATLLDLPCGKGRHAVYLNSLGYSVTGIDLSENSIEFAKQFENEHLTFQVQDMRVPFADRYDVIFNLFTSFGYFEDDNEDIAILKNIKNGLNNGGRFVFDFLNAEKVKEHLVSHEVKKIGGITFNIQREIEHNFILKHISFTAEDTTKHTYTERVKYLDIAKITQYFEEVGFTISHIFGDYDLAPFTKNSNRLIIIAQ